MYVFSSTMSIVSFTSKSDFKIDDKIYNSGEKAVRSAGNRVRKLLKCYLKLITENIHEIIVE